MQARRTMILLAITALSAMTLFLISLLDDDALAATIDDQLTISTVPDTLYEYSETVSIEPDGNARVKVSTILGQSGSGDLLLPFDFENVRDFTILSGPVSFRTDAQGVPVQTIEFLGHRMLNLARLADAAVGDTVVVQANLPLWFNRDESAQAYGEFRIKRSFINSSTFVLRDFVLAVLLPQGLLVHSIEKVHPAYSPRKNPEPPFSVARGDDRGEATLRIGKLEPTDNALLEINVRPSKRGRIPLVVGLVLAVLYLAFFRDVLKPKKTES